MSTGAIFSKIFSESLLSLYPVFVKNIDLSLPLQLLSRVSIYVLVSLVFCQMGFIHKHLFSQMGILLGMTTLIHIYSSYRGFQLLESGISYTLFYTYPIIILLLSGQPFHWSILVSLLGVYLLTMEQLKEVKPEKEAFQNDDKAIPKGNGVLFSDPSKDGSNKNEEHIENYGYEGFWMIFLAAFTEAIIYFQVRNIKTDNNWNHVFISYFFGAIVMLFYVLFYQQIPIQQILQQKQFTIAIFINAIIGTLGYYFRFYAATRMGPILYAFLSYFGIFMSFVYGVIFNKDVITWKKVLGVLLIVFSNFYIILQKYKVA